MPPLKSEPLFFPELYRRAAQASEIWLADGPSERLKELSRKSTAKPLVIFTGRLKNSGPISSGSALSLRYCLARMRPDEIFPHLLNAFTDFPEKKILSIDSAIGEGLISRHGRVLGPRARILPREPGLRSELLADPRNGSDTSIGSVESIRREHGAIVISGWCLDRKLCKPIRDLLFFHDGREIPVHLCITTRSLLMAGMARGFGECGFTAYSFAVAGNGRAQKISVVGLDGSGKPFFLHSPALPETAPKRDSASRRVRPSMIRARIDAQALPDIEKCVVTGWALDLLRKGPLSAICVYDARGRFLQSIPVRERTPEVASFFGSGKFEKSGIYAEIPLKTSAARLRFFAVDRAGSRVAEVPREFVHRGEKRISLGGRNSALFGDITTCVSDPENPRKAWVGGWVVSRKSKIRSIRLNVGGRRFQQARLFDPYLPATLYSPVGDVETAMPFSAVISVPASAKAIAPRFEAALEGGGIGRGRFQPIHLSTAYPFAPPSALAAAKVSIRASENELARFLSQGEEIRFHSVRTPALSIVLVLHNKAGITYRALRSLERYAPRNCEIVLVDNASEDRTSELLARVRGARIIRNRRNLHFILGSNEGARRSRGRYLLFLNNDCEVLPNTVQAAMARALSSPKIGAVGGRLLNPDLTLQESSIMFRADGMGSQYGFGDDPEKPEYSFVRRVPACCGAFLLTRRDVFKKLGGFNKSFLPAYCEDLDYCLRLNLSGYDVIYEPAATLIHLNHASRKSDFDLLSSAHRGQGVFRKIWMKKLAQLPQYCWAHTLKTRRVLVITRELFPPAAGSRRPGSSRALAEAIRKIDDRETQVTVFPLNPHSSDWNEIRRAYPETVEVIRDGSAGLMEMFLDSRNPGFDETHFGSRTEGFPDRIDPSLRLRMGKLIPHPVSW